MFQWVRFFCSLGVPPRAPQSDILQQLLSHILKLGSCYSLDASASSSSPPASSLSVRPLTHSDSLTSHPREQTHSHSHSTTLRLSHNQKYSQSVHSYSDSGTGPPTLRLTQATRTQRYPHTQRIHTQVHALRASQREPPGGIYTHSQIIHTQTHPTSSSLIPRLIHIQTNPYSCGRHSTWTPHGGAAWEGDTRPFEARLWGCLERGALFGVHDSFAFRAGCEDAPGERRFVYHPKGEPLGCISRARSRPDCGDVRARCSNTRLLSIQSHMIIAM